MTLRNLLFLYPTKSALSFGAGPQGGLFKRPKTPLVRRFASHHKRRSQPRSFPPNPMNHATYGYDAFVCSQEVFTPAWLIS